MWTARTLSADSMLSLLQVQYKEQHYHYEYYY